MGCIYYTGQTISESAYVYTGRARRGLSEFVRPATVRVEIMRTHTLTVADDYYSRRTEHPRSKVLKCLGEANLSSRGRLSQPKIPRGRILLRCEIYKRGDYLGRATFTDGLCLICNSRGGLGSLSCLRLVLDLVMYMNKVLPGGMQSVRTEVQTKSVLTLLVHLLPAGTESGTPVPTLQQGKPMSYIRISL